MTESLTQVTAAHPFERLAPIVTPHAVAAADVLQAFAVLAEQGLNDSEVGQRRARYGANELQSVQPRSRWRMLFDQFNNLVVGLLGFAALVAWLSGEMIEAIAILIVLALNALIGFITEWQADRALDALRRQAHTTARVRRDGRELLLDAGEIVPGDIVILNPGDSVPADARLIAAASLRTEESALTGESATVEKSAEPVAADALLAERHSMLYLGTSVTNGRAEAIVTATGVNTELGRIGKLVAEAPDESTPLENKLDDLGRRLVYLVVVIAAVVSLVGWLRGGSLWLMLEVGISLAVAAVPEGLPAVTTLILALGVLRMARQRAIVRRLSSVETLGSATIICSDKTGTLTENRMTVREYRLADGSLLSLDRPRLTQTHDELLTRAVRVSVLCNEASFATEAIGPAADNHVVGDPTETALLTAADALGLDVNGERERYAKLHEIPFDAATKRMLTVHRVPDGARLAVLKGGAGAVMEACTNYAASPSTTQALTDEMRRQFLAVNEQMAEGALRVLALAEKRGSESDDLITASPLTGFTLLGFVGMIDPPRAEVADALAQARQAGIRVVMLTGDQLNTACAIARELRLNGKAEPHALHASDLPAAGSEQLAEKARTVDVFARVSPEDKLRIVEALQQAGEIVAVTGDGVNDAPALKRADIGIAMGERGTEVAKEASDVVLADDNFATIVKAIEGGRTIYANIIKFVHLLFTANLAEVLVIFTAIVIGWPLPLLPLQILWINLVTDVFPALALALEPPAPEVMQQPPRPPQQALLSRSFLTLMAWQGTLLAVITLAAYAWALQKYGAGAHARSIAMLTLVGVQIGHLFNCRSRTRSAFSGLFRNPYIWGAVGIVAALQLLALYFAPLAQVLRLVPPNPSDWLVVAQALIAPIFVVEITKFMSRRQANGRVPTNS